MLPSFTPDGEALDFIRKTIHGRTRGTMRVQEVLKILMLKPRTDFQKAERMALQNNPAVTPQILDAATPNDFRAVMKQILEAEEDFIPDSIAKLRDDPETYNRVLLGWAKFVHPQEKNVNVNVEVKQKADMYAAMFEQYGYSTQVEDAEIIYDEPSALPQPQQQPSDASLDPMSSFVAPQQAANTPPSGTLDGVNSPETETTTPPSWHNMPTVDDPFMSPEEQELYYSNEDPE